MKEVDEKTGDLKNNLKTVLKENTKELMYLVPNIPSPETPIGADASENVPWRYWNPALGVIDPTKDTEKVKEIPHKFDFEIKDHLALGKI